MAERNTDRIRYRYGICLNDNCEKCKSKEVRKSLHVRNSFALSVVSLCVNALLQRKAAIRSSLASLLVLWLY